MRSQLIACLVAGSSLLGLGACSEYGYRYHPQPQVLYSPIFADYREAGDKVDILVDTDGLKLRNIDIAQPNGTLVPASKIDFPTFQSELMGGTDSPAYGPAFAEGPTVAHFDKSKIGPGPWKVQVKIHDVPKETILVGND